MFVKLEKQTYPFLHFISEGHSLPVDAAQDFVALAKPSVLIEKRGSRADYKKRMFFNKASYSGYTPAIQNFFDRILSSDFEEFCVKKFDVDLRGSKLRAELVCDIDGFFQVPHTDVGDKRISWLTYLGTPKENNDVGTDLFEDDETYALSAPWNFNNGLIFKPGPETFHGFTKGKKIKGYRKVLIINFVDNWQDKHELYS